MDGLALLCTLHADGPSTLKRLRRAGFPTLDVLLERPATDLADALDVSPAAARRMLREARFLAERVGPDLELEEAPEGLPSGAGELRAPDLPESPALDRTDRRLVEQIARKPAPAADAPRPAAANVPPRPAAAPGRAESASQASQASQASGAAALRDVELRPMPTLEQVLQQPLGADAGSVVELSAAAEAPAERAEPVEPAEPVPPAGPAGPAGAPRATGLAAAGIEGLDADLAADLAGLGITTPAELAAADSLRLRRDLGVTFAQARRLAFLARRALAQAPDDAAPVDVAPPPAAAPPVAAPPAAAQPPVATESAGGRAPGRAPGRAAGPAGESQFASGVWATEPPTAPAPRPGPAAPIGESQRSATHSQPATSVAAIDAPAARRAPWMLPAREDAANAPRTGASSPSPSASASSAAPRGAESEAAGVASPRPRFWEPRAHLSAEAERVARVSGEAQGELVDPAEVSRPRRFWESRQADCGAGSDASGGTTLGWNWSLDETGSGPAQVDLSEPPPAGSSWEPLGRRSVDDEDTSAGPFA